jgi:hypothetical protein
VQKMDKRKPYEKPTASQLTHEQAKEKLLRLARQGDKEAERIFETLFPEESKTPCK